MLVAIYCREREGATLQAAGVSRSTVASAFEILMLVAVIDGVEYGDDRGVVVYMVGGAGAGTLAWTRHSEGERGAFLGVDFTKS